MEQTRNKLFDLQVNGFAGVDFQAQTLELDTMLHAVHSLRAHGTVGILFTLITDSVCALCQKLEGIEALRRQDKRIAEMVKGYHLEGPWISTESGYHGAHPRELAWRPCLEDFQRLYDAAGGNLKLITLAPELGGAIEIIEHAISKGIRIGLGHTNASESAIDDAINAGATLATHLGNAVPTQMHRHDNVVQRLLARDELIACLIPDGIHLPLFALKNFYRAKPAGRVFFTTDSMSAAGSPPGVYPLAGHNLEVGKDGVVHLPGDDRFAGSSLTMDVALRNVIDWLGVDEQGSIAMCSSQPAEHFGIELEDREIRGTKDCE
ncbi:hypothetical protein VDG1235_2790 [Verrucomicrobiia bacterium DG1235]|nr:hypothetical protein VDG1235_2790 [Verrucomicrobiae bacterium DG1235]